LRKRRVVTKGRKPAFFLNQEGRCVAALGAGNSPSCGGGGEEKGEFTPVACCQGREKGAVTLSPAEGGKRRPRESLCKRGGKRREKKRPSLPSSGRKEKGGEKNLSMARKKKNITTKGGKKVLPYLS